MKDLSHLRVAWLLPILGRRSIYWQPVLREFSRMIPETVVYTGLWSGYAPGCEGGFRLKLLGRTRLLPTGFKSCITGDRSCIALPPLRIFYDLLRFRPDIVFTSSFTLWTAFVVCLRIWKGVRVVIAYDGSAPNVDMTTSRLRLFFRRIMVRFVDALITNSDGGKTYLANVLKAEESSVFARPYQVPDVASLLACENLFKLSLSDVQRPLFLFVGEITPRKGLHFLLEACAVLRKRGCNKWTLLIVGDGPQRKELEGFMEGRGLEDCVRWTGWVNYRNLGVYFQAADVFILPTLEDIWGMVVLEAMAFGKPILCSKWAGAAEMVVEGENGYVIDPHQPDQVADRMKRFINNSSLIQLMGERSREKIASHTAEAVAKHLSDVVAFVLNKV